MRGEDGGEKWEGEGVGKSPGSRWGSLQRSPRPLAGNEEGPPGMGGKRRRGGREERGREGKGWEGTGKGYPPNENPDYGLAASAPYYVPQPCREIDAYASDLAGGAYSAPPDPLAGLRGPTSKGRGGNRKGRGGEGEGIGEGRGREREGSRRGGHETPLHAPLIHISGYAPVNLQSINIIQ